MVGVTKKKFISGTIWRVLERFSNRGIALIFSIILTRMLSPGDYGLIALTVVFTNFSDILIDGGFSTALIRKKRVDNEDYTCVLCISLFISTILYIILFFCAPYVAAYYQEPQLISILRVIGCIFFIQAFSCVRNAILNRNMQFRLLFFCNLIGTIVSGIIGIIAAWMKLGVWALVLQRILQLFFSNLLMFIFIRWKPCFKFSLNRLKEILGFSSGVVVSSFLNYFSGSIYSLIIGKKYSVDSLGYYDKGSQLPTQISLYTFGAMSTVLLPTLSKCQNDLQQFKHIVRKVVSMTAFLITPMMIGLSLVSKELTILLFTETWSDSIVIMQWNCLYYYATPFMLINVQIFFALGHSNLRVQSELIRLIMMISGALIFGYVLDCDVAGLTAVSAFIAVLSAIITYAMIYKRIDYKVKELLHDILKPTVISVVMGIILIIIDRYLILVVGGTLFIPLIIKTISGVLIYLLLSFIFKVDELKEILNIFKTLRRSNG